LGKYCSTLRNHPGYLNFSFSKSLVFYCSKAQLSKFTNCLIPPSHHLPPDVQYYLVSLVLLRLTMDDYYVPASLLSLEFRVVNSKFIATISPAFSVEQAKIFINKVNKKYADATHNVPAYIIGHGSSLISHCSDNGEPSGTAGRPALSVLKGSGLGDTVLVISRYFGGTKLGTGGLVKAYGDSAREIIAAVPKAKKTLVHIVSLECPYPLYEQIKRTIRKHQGEIKSEDFTDKISLVYSISVKSYEILINSISELSNGQIHPEIIKSDQVSLIPSGNFS